MLSDDVRNAMRQLGVEYVPSRGELESINMGWLSTRIQRAGGFRKIASDLGVKNKRGVYADSKFRESSHMKWNFDVAKREILRIKDEIGLDRMPTRNEIINHEGNGALCSYISRSCGYYSYADQLGLDIKKSGTTTGKVWEREVTDSLESFGYRVEKMPQNYPYDLLVDGCLKIDVKFGNLYHGPSGNFYRFSWKKKHATCDLYVLISQSKKNQCDRTYRVIPSCHITNVSGLSIGENTSIYDVYIDRWDYIKKYLLFYSDILNKHEQTA